MRSTRTRPLGTAVGITALASDGDATTNGITYSLDDDAGGQFAIDPSTGVVTVAGAIDREAGATRSITVRATSDDGSTTTQSYTIAIHDLDEFDITPISDSDPAADAVDENAAVGTAVGITALASDGDATTNGITYSLDDDAGGQFAIDPSTGVVTVAGAIDREAGATRSITVRATSDDGSTTTQSYTIAIHDLDEFDITPISDSDATADAVDENAALGTAVGITAQASDGDATTNGITYSLDDDAGGQFAIDPTTGVVTVAGAIDREAGATRTITVRATSDDGSTTTQSYTIAINDLDEFDITPISDSDPTADAVDENAAIGTAVGITALASDGDATTNGITYSLDDDAGGQFAIDPATGVVTVAGAIDREAGATVRSPSAPPATTVPRPRRATRSRSTTWTNSTSRPSATATRRPMRSTRTRRWARLSGITALASDGDATTNGITYSLDDDAGGQFAIDPTTGVVTVAGAIDREAGATRSITVRATSDDGSTTTQSYTITIHDLDEFDITPISDSDLTADAVDENAAVGTAVGITASASDGDATTNGITYSLDDDAGGQFAIDPTTGVVTVAGAIDREAGATVRSRSAPPATTVPRPRRATRSRSTTWTNSTSRPSATATRRPMRSTRTQRSVRQLASRPGQRRRCDDQRHHLLAGRRRGRTIRHRSGDRRGDRGRGHRPRGGGHPVDHGPRHQRRWFHGYADLHRYDPRPGRIRHHAARGHGRYGRRGGRIGAGTPVGITARRRTRMRPTGCATRWTTTRADGSRSTRSPAWSAWPGPWITNPRPAPRHGPSHQQRRFHDDDGGRRGDRRRR